MNEISHEELARYLAGDLSQDDDRRVRQWLADHPVIAARVMDSRSELAPVNKDPEAFLESLLGEKAGSIHPGERAGSASEHRERGSPGVELQRGDRSARRREASRFTRTTRAALAVLILVAAGLFARDQLRPQGRAVQYATAAGEYTEVTLPDGSDVKLNVASRLEVSGEFGTGQRVVRLEGEAYFDVAFDPRHPFIIEAGELDVTVLGTAFDVLAYPDDGVTSVVVSEGSVRVRSETREETLNPGQRATLASGVLQIGEADLDLATAWTHGRLVFRATPMRDVARSMERWYGIRVALRDTAIGSMKLDAVFDTDAVGEAAQTIAAALDLRVEVDEDQVVFKTNE